MGGDCLSPSQNPDLYMTEVVRTTQQEMKL